MTRFILVGLWLALVSPALAEPIAIRSERIALDRRDASHVTVGRVTFLSGLVLSGSASAWGGFSGMTITPDGSSLLAVADTGLWLRMRLVHDSQSRLVGVSDGQLSPLLDESGSPLATKWLSDAEAVARDTDGSLLVAFERRHRVWRYRAGDDPAKARPAAVETPPALASLPPNSGIEALVVLPPDSLLLLSEGVANPSGDIRGWLRQGRKWSEISLAPSSSFAPTDMALLPNGDVLLLEHHFGILGGIRARLSILLAADLRPGARLVGREVAVLQQPLNVDNFEAVAARRAPHGGTLIYLLSDDNQSPLQRTLLYQFQLD